MSVPLVTVDLPAEAAAVFDEAAALEGISRAGAVRRAAAVYRDHLLEVDSRVDVTVYLGDQLSARMHEPIPRKSAPFLVISGHGVDIFLHPVDDEQPTAEEVASLDRLIDALTAYRDRLDPLVDLGRRDDRQHG
ncbi:MAG TPA: ribbon-helix-helix protein, CopG family [Kribbellaceae bacterium]|nr:ribbon-helix-helix protein, CopG family [Kribbellaceae bacterium]